jgi:hypothetical protein
MRVLKENAKFRQCAVKLLNKVISASKVCFWKKNLRRKFFKKYKIIENLFKATRLIKTQLIFGRYKAREVSHEKFIGNSF